MCYIITHPPAQNLLKEMYDFKITILGFKMREEKGEGLIEMLFVINVNEL